jgi:hypothetical protein
MDVELKLEPHVRWKRGKVVEVVGCVNASDLAVGAKCETFYLIAALKHVARWQKARMLKKVLNIKNDDSPSVDV